MQALHLGDCSFRTCLRGLRRRLQKPRRRARSEPAPFHRQNKSWRACLEVAPDIAGRHCLPTGRRNPFHRAGADSLRAASLSPPNTCRNERRQSPHRCSSPTAPTLRARHKTTPCRRARQKSTAIDCSWPGVRRPATSPLRRCELFPMPARVQIAAAKFQPCALNVSQLHSFKCQREVHPNAPPRLST